MRIVISAINIVEGGPLTILRDCLRSARNCHPADTEIIALVHDAVSIDIPGVRLVRYSHAGSSWLRRIYVEYFEFRKFSKVVRPDFWLSLHDTSPRLNGEPQAVYCHNPAPFFRPKVRDIFFQPSLLVFRLFYRLVYRFNIKANDAVVVQQQWLRDRLRGDGNAITIIVAHPRICDLPALSSRSADTSLSLFYPALPRPFKNVELLCEAMSTLPAGLERVPKLSVTIDGTENRYARFLVKRYGHVAGIAFIGRQSRAQMARLYADCDVLLFPSRLETWGLPITEAQQFRKPVIVADEPYAREVVGNYHAAAFLPANRPRPWRDAIVAASKGEEPWTEVRIALPAYPFVEGWDALWRRLTYRLQSGGMKFADPS